MIHVNISIHIYNIYIYSNKAFLLKKNIKEYYIGKKLTHPMLNIAVQAIRKAGNFIIKQYEFLNRIHLASSSSYNMNIIISKIHSESNLIIKTTIKKFYPLHTISTDKNDVSHQKKSNNNVHWIVESIDNNTNFIKQFPFFALSIAVQYNKHIEIGVIYDPIHNELFSACRGKGAQCNGYRIRLKNNPTKNLNNSILSISNTSLKYDTTSDLVHKLHRKYTAINIRYTGSACLDLAYVASGRIDGCFIIPFNKTNNKLASGILIVQEAGGLIADYSENKIPNHFIADNIIVGNLKIIKIILSLLKERI